VTLDDACVAEFGRADDEANTKRRGKIDLEMTTILSGFRSKGRQTGEKERLVLIVFQMTM
jgi:hypothetical protein